MQTSEPVPQRPSPPRSQASGRSGPRTRTGCLTCRRRKVRCDQSSAAVEARRRCGNCVRLELECYFAPPNTERKSPRRGNGRGNTSGISDIRGPTDTSSVDYGHPCTGAPTQKHNGRSGAADGCTYPVEIQQPAYVSSHASTTSVDQMQLDRVLSDMPELTSFSSAPQWSPAPFTTDLMSPVPGLYTSSLLPWKGFSEIIPTNNSASYGSAGRNDNHDNNKDDVDSHQNQRDRIPSSSVAPISHLRSTPAASPSAGIDLALFDVTEHQRQLLLNFAPKENPIPLITPTDSQWKSAYSSLVGMACGCAHLINAICAISELSLAASKKGTVSQAFTYYQNAAIKAEAVLNLPSTRVDDRSLKQAFASLLLLMQAEIMAQPLAGHHNWPTTRLRQAYLHLKRHSERIRLWTGIGSRIISWVQIVDNKAVYSAGMGKESNRPSTEPNINSSCSPGVTTTDVSPLTKPSPATDRSVHISPGHSATIAQPYSAASPTASEIPADSPLDEPPSAAEIAYDALHEPAYKFFMRSQSLIPHIIALDPYHRSRGPLDDELQVLQLGQRLRGELRDMWLKRPSVLGVLSDTEGLQEVLHPHVAGKIIRGFRSFVANFHAVRIFLHRVVFIQYPASDEVKLAITEILRLAREQLADEVNDSRLHVENKENYQGEAENGVGGDTRTTRTSEGGTPDAYHQGAHIQESQSAREEEPPSTGPHPTMLWLWPLFMCGTECSAEDRQWVLERMYAMRSVNAERTAVLLAEVTRQQDETGKRVDQRTVRRRIFDDEFDVVY